MTIKNSIIKEILNLKHNGYADAYIAKGVGVSSPTVKQYCIKNGFKYKRYYWCLFCNKKLEVNRKGRAGKFCCESCRRNWWECNKDKKKTYVHQCQYCFICFENHLKSQKYCSYYCEGLSRRGKSIKESTKIINGKRFCTDCLKWKKIKNFTKSANMLNGLDSKCKKCKSKNWKKYYSDPENKKKKMKKAKEYRNTTIGKLKNEIRRKKYLPTKNLKEREKANSDPMFRLNRSMRVGMAMSLRGNKNGRAWESLVDYNLNSLRKHLQKQFKDGMAWANYGEWHIDHIIPHSVFNFTLPEHIDFKRCWALKNLRPLWGAENIIKGNKLEKPFQPKLPI